MHTCKAMMNVGYKTGKAVAQGDINIAEFYSNWAKDIIKEADNKEELIQRFRGEFSRGCHRHCKGAIMDSFEARIDRNLPPDSVLHNVYSRKIKQISSSHLSVLVENEDAPMGAEIFLWKDDQKTWYKLPPIDDPIPVNINAFISETKTSFDSLPDDGLNHFMNEDINTW